MRAQDVRDMLKRQPFIPFQIQLTDGRVMQVQHPDQVMVARDVAHVGLLESEPSVYQRIEMVALLHIVSLEPVAAA